jgi:excisionase family DNA binding protein
VILFDPATATDVLDAFRLLEGRLRGTGRRLARGTVELREVAERSRRVTTDHPTAGNGCVGDDVLMVELYTLDETAERLRASVSTVKRLAREGLLPVVHVGRSARVRPEDLRRYIDSLPASLAARNGDGG